MSLSLPYPAAPRTSGEKRSSTFTFEPPQSAEWILKPSLARTGAPADVLELLGDDGKPLPRGDSREMPVGVVQSLRLAGVHQSSYLPATRTRTIMG